MYNVVIIVKGAIIIANNTTLKEQFSSFYKDNKLQDLQKALELFSIFGGAEFGGIDIQEEDFALVKKLILDDYTYIRNDISDMTTGMPLLHSILSGIALGDGRTHSVFKKAGVDSEVGIQAVTQLCEAGVIRIEKSHKEFTSWAEDYKISDKLLFNTPFLKFWFTFISPLFKGIKGGDYKEVSQRFLNRKTDLVSFTYEQLTLELLKIEFKNDPIVEIGSYWDKDVEIDIYAKTTSGKIIVGTTRYSNTKVKKSELSKLQQKCEVAKIAADIYVVSAKKGFSNELKSMKSETLKLFTLKSFKILI